MITNQIFFSFANVTTTIQTASLTIRMMQAGRVWQMDKKSERNFPLYYIAFKLLEKIRVTWYLYVVGRVEGYSDRVIIHVIQQAGQREIVRQPPVSFCQKIQGYHDHWTMKVMSLIRQKVREKAMSSLLLLQ